MAKKKTTRRGNNEGSIFQRKDKKWAAQITVGYDENGRRCRKTIYGNTKAEVKEKMNTALANTPKSTIILSKGNSLAEHMKFWLLKYKRHTISPRTFEREMRNYRLYVAPQIGELNTRDVATDHVQTLLGRMLDDNYALDTVKKVKYILSQYFEYCVENDIIVKNPVVKVKLKSRERKGQKLNEEPTYKAIPEEVRDKFLLAISTDKFLKPLCLTEMFAGLRIGEVLALKWKDINFKKQTLAVVRAQTSEPTFNEEGNVINRKTTISDTKTAGSVREVPLPLLLVNELREWKRLRSLQEQMNDYSLTKQNNLIFGTNEGTLRSYYGTRNMFDRLMKKNGLADEKIHFYCLRHTFSNTLFEAETNPKVVQLLMGHKKTETTMIYNTATGNKYLRGAMDIFDNRYVIPKAEATQPPDKTATPLIEPKEELTDLMKKLNVSSVSELEKVISELLIKRQDGVLQTTQHP